MIKYKLFYEVLYKFDFSIRSEFNILLVHENSSMR